MFGCWKRWISSFEFVRLDLLTFVLLLHHFLAPASVSTGSMQGAKNGILYADFQDYHEDYKAMCASGNLAFSFAPFSISLMHLERTFVTRDMKIFATIVHSIHLSGT